jgi:hypothetical protein
LLRPEALPPTPSVPAVVISSLPASPGTFAFLRPPSLPRNEPMANIRGLASRPPPAA